MRILNLQQTASGDAARVSAQIVWEDSDRPAQEIYYEVPLPFADGLTFTTDAFVVAGCLPAMRHGERRLAVESALCPELKCGLDAAMRLLQYWYGGNRRPVTIEAKVWRESFSSPSRRAAFFFSGGVDSLATLRMNRLAYPEQHPRSFGDGLLIFGLEIEQRDAFQHVLDQLSVFARSTGVTTIPVYTNVRSLDESWRFWECEFQAAALASTAHALDRRLGSATIGSTYDYSSLRPLGSHPLLDPSYSSTALQVRHDGAAVTRLEKTRLLAEWDVALQSLRVCNRPEIYRPGVLNCGTCEKCLRTLTGLLIAGRLEKAQVFGNRDVTPELIEANVLLTNATTPLWQELVRPLEELGREDLVRPIRTAISRHRRKGRWARTIVAFDEQHLNGGLRRLKRAVAPPRPGVPLP